MSRRSKILVAVGLVVLALVIMISVFSGDETAMDNGAQSGGLAEGAEDGATLDGSNSRIQIVESNGTITASDPDVVVPPTTEDEPALSGADSFVR